MECSSLTMLLRWRRQRTPHERAFLQMRGGVRSELTWSDAYAAVRDLALGLRALGVRPGDRVALIAASRIEWVLCDLAILSTGGISVPIFPTSTARDILTILINSDARVAILENARLLDKLHEVRAELPAEMRWLFIDGPASDEAQVRTLGEVTEAGRREATPYETLAAAVSPHDTATLIYTANQGTWLGVELTHAALLAEQQFLADALPCREGDTALVLLPLAHIFGRTLEYGSLYHGLCLAFPDAHARFEQSLLEFAPHLVAAVPRVYQKVLAAHLKEIESQGRLAQTLFAWARRIGEQVARLPHRALPLALELRRQAARRLVFERFRAHFGPRVVYLISSGAPLPQDVGEFFHAAGLPILEAYGMTETAGAVTLNRQDNHKVGRVGRPLSGTEIRLDDDGEVLVKGPTVMKGYWREPERTRAAFADGWLRTGDIGEFDEDGFLRIIDRKKDILITMGGRHISPLTIENLFKSDPYIEHVYAHGDKRPFISALITLNRESVETWARTRGVRAPDFAALLAKPELRALLDEHIHQKNRELAAFAAIKRFAVLPAPFSIEGGELTPTLKLNRRHIEQKYRTLLDGFYA